MLENFSRSLKELEKAFMINSKEVIRATNKLESAFNDVELDLSKSSSIDKNDVKTTFELLEKLSIQNDYKLGLLKDFPEYLLHKK